MKKKLNSALSVLALSAVVLASSAIAQTASPDADNTRMNKHTRHAARGNADQQSNRTSDVDMTREIRKQVVEDESLSTYAHNVKIISKNGKVTLRGPIRSEDERAKLLEIARGVTGEGKITDRMDVATK